MILITGASSGLGAALAKQYSSDREEVVLVGRNSERLSRVSAELASKNQHFCCDLANTEQVSALFDQLDTPKRVVHCAGSGYFGYLDKQETTEIAKLIENNLLSTINLVKELVSRYKDQEVELVIVMSTASLAPKAGESTYCAVKWAVRGLVESVRLELKGKAMNLVCVYPGGMATDFWPTSGKDMNVDTFMSADEAASMIKGALQSTDSGYVSDITVNRYSR